MNSSSATETLEDLLRRSSLPQISIRAVQLSDLHHLSDLLTDSFHPRTGLMQWLQPLLRVGIYEDLRNRLRTPPPHYVCLAAMYTGSSATSSYSSNYEMSYGYEYLVGTVEMALRPAFSWHPRSQYLYVSNLAVRAEYRRQGIAQQLLLACERIALHWSFKDLYLHVLENNYQARNLYYKQGYCLQQIEHFFGIPLIARNRRLLLHKNLIFAQQVDA